MRIGTRFTIFIDRFRRKVRDASKTSINRTAALIRLEARQSMRIRKRASPPGTPPSARTRGGLREINYHVSGNTAIIGPRRFRGSNSLNRPVPNVHEKGGIAIAKGRRGHASFVKRFPERSFMYRAVKTLKSKGKLSSKFKYMLRSF